MAQINFSRNLVNFAKKLIILSIKFYQRFLTFFIGANTCRFAPSCSNYMIEAIEKKGLIKGIYLGLLRILRCNPFSKKSGFDPVDRQ